jgi:hypothetical protein
VSLALEVAGLVALHLAVALPLLVASERDRTYYETEDQK